MMLYCTNRIYFALIAPRPTPRTQRTPARTPFLSARSKPTDNKYSNNEWTQPRENSVFQSPACH
jgi:hypothetical protein